MDIRTLLADAGIDPELSLQILETVREMDEKGSAGAPGSDAYNGFPVPPPLPGGMLPPVEHRDVSADLILEVRSAEPIRLRISPALLRSRLEQAGMSPENLARLGELLGYEAGSAGEQILDRQALHLIGLAALPLVSYGVLNGGSATSYSDEKKNRDFNLQLFELYGEHFQRLAALAGGRAKGITPAYINPDGSPGASYLELKIRAVLLLILEYRKHFGLPKKGKSPLPLLPLFHMDSSGNHQEIADALESYRSSALISPLLEELFSDRTGPVEAPGDPWRDPLSMEGASQPLIAALTHSSSLKNGPRDLFMEAWGKSDSPLPLPGGHGQSFFALEACYRRLSEGGKRLALLGNVDNLAYIPDPTEIALMILYQAPAGFEFSYKTEVDRKGGVLLELKGGKYTCADIGPAVSSAQVKEAEDRGLPVLFNCASGIFSLPWLMDNIRRIQASLPIRVTDQDKDAGLYSQAEQVTWEVMSLIPGFLAFGVDKFDRFLAAKLLMDSFLSSGLKLESPGFPDELQYLARKLHGGFIKCMNTACGMRLEDGHWVPDQPAPDEY